MPKIGDVIASLRRKKGIRQNDFAGMIGINIAYLSCIERCTRPAIKLLPVIAAKLEVDISIILFECLDDRTEIDFATFSQAKRMIDKMLSIIFKS